MKLQAFYAGDGDCLLLSSNDGHHILIDGGRSGTFKKHTIPVLQKLADEGKTLDLVCVSHVDNDHISGVLELADAVVEAEVFRFQTEVAGNAAVNAPDFVPPFITEVWHNSFAAQLGDDALAADVADMTNRIATFFSIPAMATAAAAEVSGLVPGPAKVSAASITRWAEAADNLATGIKEGIELRNLFDMFPAAVQVNHGFDNDLVLRDQVAVPERTYGGLTVSLVAPSVADLEDLRHEWNDWVVDHRDEIDTLGTASLALAGRTTAITGALPSLRQAAIVASSLASSAGIAAEANTFADIGKVTPENRASIAFLIDEGTASILFTGDAHQTELLNGLESLGRLPEDGRFHCDILKVQHHGSEHNLDIDFARRVTADIYLFCGNGGSGNPEISVVDAIIDARAELAALGDDPLPADYELAFTAEPSVISGPVSRQSFTDLQAHIETRRQDQPGVVATYLEPGTDFREFDL